MTIPANTTAGKHTINAAAGVGGQTGMASLADTTVNVGPGGGVTHPTNAGVKPQASMTITVVGGAAGGRSAVAGGALVGAPGGALGGGGNATITVMNTGTHTAMKPPAKILYPSTITLHGAGFAPNAMVTVYLDSTVPKSKLGTANTGKAGMFLGKFQLLNATTGTHQLVAVQTTKAGTRQATVQVELAAQPK